MPCNGHVPGYNEAQGIAQELASTLVPIADAPFCIQWAVVERTGKGGNAELRADHPVRWAAALANMVRGIHLLARENSEFQLGAHVSLNARIDYYEPTLFVRTPTLYLFDAASGELTTTDRLTIGQHFELFDGRQELRQIDVWTGEAVGEFAKRYKTVRDNFEQAIPSLGARLVRAGIEQRERFQRERAIEHGLSRLSDT